MVTTRFAPSPTGFMHIGNLRSALYSYLTAKSQNGIFKLRIEDTDKAREVEGAVDVILKTLDKTGLKYDDYSVQSSRKEIYIQYARKLVEKDKAYICFCSSNEDECNCRNINCTLEDLQSKDFVIRFKMPKEGRTSFHDEVFGDIEVDNKTLDDIVLIKSDGFPTYNFAHIVDDHLMGITHVVRGNEYLASTPKYVNIYKAFGWEIPIYVHLPLIMGKDENGNVSKLSKRHGAVSFDDLIAKGYLPEAILNYIAFLGWNPKTNKEIYSLEELEKDFSINKINKAPAIFDYTKLDWYNKQYYGKMSKDDFYNFTKRCLADWSLNSYNNFNCLGEEQKKYLIELTRTRVSNFDNLKEVLKFIVNFSTVENVKNNDYYTDGIDDDSINRVLCELSEYDWYIRTPEDAKNVLSQIVEKLNTSNTLNEVGDKLNLKMKHIAWITRIALVGVVNTPGGATDMLYIYSGFDRYIDIEGNKIDLKYMFKRAYKNYLKRNQNDENE